MPKNILPPPQILGGGINAGWAKNYGTI